MSKDFITKVSSITRIHSQDDNNKISVANYFSPKRKLLELIHKREEKLFCAFSNKSFPSDFLLQKDILHKINTRAGDKNPKTYELINEVLSTPGELRFFLNYNICKEYLEKMDQIIAEKEKTSSLIDGL